jgi:hypothetical protein
MRSPDETTGAGPQIMVAGADRQTAPTDRELIFVHIQKTGGSSILKALGREMHSRHKHRFASEFRDMYGQDQWDRAYKFAFVRNPWDRLVSWWSMVNHYRDAYAQGAKFNRFFTYILQNGHSFEDFILNCDADIEDIDGRKCIFRNQLDYVTDSEGRIIVDYIGRFETLAVDFNQLSAKLRLPDDRLEHKNRSDHKPYTAYYTPETRARVEIAYARDIAAFNYEFGG